MQNLPPKPNINNSIIFLLLISQKIHTCLVTNCLTCISSQTKPICDYCEEGYEKKSEIGENKEIFDTCTKEAKTNIAMILTILIFLGLITGIIIWFLIIKVWLVNPNKASLEPPNERETVKINRNMVLRKQETDIETERENVLTTPRDPPHHPLKPVGIGREVQIKRVNVCFDGKMTPKKKIAENRSTASGGRKSLEKRHHLSFTPGRVTKFIQNALRKKYTKEKEDDQKFKEKNKILGGDKIQEKIDFDIQVSKVILNLNDDEVKKRSEKKLTFDEDRKKSLMEMRKKIFDSQSNIEFEKKKEKSFNPYLNSFKHDEVGKKKSKKINKTENKNLGTESRDMITLKESPRFIQKEDTKLDISSDEEENLFQKISPKKPFEAPITLSSYIVSPQKVRVFDAPKKFTEKKKKKKSNTTSKKSFTKKITCRASLSRKSPVSVKKIELSRKKKTLRKIVNERYITKEEYESLRRGKENKFQQEKYFSFDREKNLPNSENSQNEHDDEEFKLDKRPVLISKKKPPSRKTEENPFLFNFPEPGIRKVEIRKINKNEIKKNWMKKPELRPEKSNLSVGKKIQIEGKRPVLRSRSVNNDYNRGVGIDCRRRSQSVQKELVRNGKDPFLAENKNLDYDPKNVLKFKIDIPRPLYSRKPQIDIQKYEEKNFMEKSSESFVRFDEVPPRSHSDDDFEFEDSSRSEIKPGMIYNNLPLIVEESEEYDISATISAFDKSTPKYYKYEFSHMNK